MAEIWGAALATVAVGVYSANKASSSANKAANKQQAAMDNQTQLGQDQLDFAKQQYADWKQRFDPIMNDLEAQAYAQQRPDYTKISADNTAAFDASQGAAQRNLERFGINPADGAYANLQQKGSLQRALGLVTANTQARNAAKDATFNRLMSVYGVGNGQGAQALNSMNSAYQGLGAAFGQQAGLYGNQFNNFSNQAQAGWNDAASGVGYGLKSWFGSSNTGATTPSYQPNVGTAQPNFNVGTPAVGGAPNPFGDQ